MLSIVITCFLLSSLSTRSLVHSEEESSCAQCFDSMRVSEMQSTNRMVFRLKSNNTVTTDNDRRRPQHHRIHAHSHRNSDHLLDDQLPSDDSSAAHQTSSQPTPNTFRGRQRPKMAVVPNTNRYRGMRKRTTTAATTTTTTSTKPPPIDDYYEYDDYYDDDYIDYQLTTTTTTTTIAPKRRQRGRRRFRSTTTTTTSTTTLSPNYIPRPDGRVIDYLADPNFPYELKGADLTEYPFYISIPENGFDCKGRHDGYYANVDLHCQVYHHCAVGHQRYDFLCPNYTLFDQTTFTCRFVNTVDCLSSEEHYKRNNELYVQSSTSSTPLTPPVAPSLTQQNATDG